MDDFKKLKENVAQACNEVLQVEPLDELSKAEENLNELSNELKGRYIRKSKADSRRLEKAQQKDMANVNVPDSVTNTRQNKIVNRMIGRVRASGKRWNEETTLDELSKETLSNYRSKRGYGTGRTDKEYNKRRLGLVRARERLQGKYVGRNEKGDAVWKDYHKENMEPLDELSKRTLGNYVKDADQDHANKSVDYINARGRTAKDRLAKKGINRRVGIIRAVNRLAKEEADPSLAIEMSMRRRPILPHIAQGILDNEKAHGDFHTLSFATQSNLADHAKHYGYRKPRNANGSTARYFHAHLLKRAKGIRQETKTIKEDWDKMSHDAKELVLHGDNDQQLHYSNRQPIINNLTRKHNKGIYDHEKAKKLWKYHADFAAQSYARQHGGTGAKWHHMFSPEARREAAHHWADWHRDEHGWGDKSD